METNVLNKVFDHIEKYSSFTAHNTKLLDIFEGELEPYVLEKIQKQVSANAYQQIKQRLCPINVLTKIIEKLSRIYAQPPRRIVLNGNDNDEKLLKSYENDFLINQNMNTANEFFNLHRGCLLEPFIYNGKPRLRSIPYNCFLPFSFDRTDPNKPTGYIIFQGKDKDKNGDTVSIYHIVTSDQFLIVNSKRQILYDKMAEYNNQNGLNPYGVLPYVYINKSKNLLIPKADVDSFALSCLIPILLADINYAVLYQSFSILWTIDVDASQIELNPNAVWNLKSDGEGERKPEIGSIKPQIDIQETLNLIQAELGFWLSTRGIKSTAVGPLNVDQASSGISKMMDELDVSNARLASVEYFQNAEMELWNLVLHKMHPIWARNGMIENRYEFTPSASIETIFAEQLPVVSRGNVVRDLNDEMAAGFISRKRAIKKLNPRLSDTEIDELIAEIDAEKTLYIDESNFNGDDNGNNTP